MNTPTTRDKNLQGSKRRRRPRYRIESYLLYNKMPRTLKRENQQNKQKMPPKN